MPSVFARSPRVQSIIWFEVQSVSLSPSQAAIDACGSIIACDLIGRGVGLVELDRRRGERAGEVADGGIGRRRRP